MARRHAAPLAALAGVLLVLAGAGGGSLLLEVGGALAMALLPAPWGALAGLLVSLLLVIAGLGGLAVLGGAVAYRRRWWRTGTLLVDLGAGLGLLGLAATALVALARAESAGFAAWLLGPAGVGVLLSIAARAQAPR